LGRHGNMELSLVESALRRSDSLTPFTPTNFKLCTAT
jgi:hypothetical protein